MLDAHHHLWKYRADQYPWIPPGSALAQDYLIPELLRNTDAAGVTGTVVVQARQSLEESDWLLSLAEESERILGVVGWVPLAAEGVDEHLGRLGAHPMFKGVRHVVQDEPDDEFILGPEFNRGIARLSAHDLVYDILIFQKHLPPTLAFVDRHPNQPFVLDHVAKPVIHNGRIEKEWRKGMAALAERDQVVAVKFSGLVTEVTDEELDPETLRNYLHETLELFGPARVCFGTDWPVCLLRIGSYRDWAAMVREFIADLSTDEQDSILSGTCRRAYRL